MRRSLAVLLAPSLLIACSCGAASEPARETTAPASSVESPAAAAQYDVHEWGLLRALPGDLLSVGAVAPAVRRMPMAVDKPVLYFHLVDGALTLRSVSVDAHGGSIVEAWPSPPRTGDASQLRWMEVALGGDGACEPSPLPTTSDTACTALPPGDLCETAQLARVRATSAACVRTAGITDSLLFYRARTRSFTPPLTFERTQVFEDVTVTNTGDQPIPGWIVRLRDDYGSVSTIALRPPAPHESLVFGHDYRAAAAADRPVAADESMLATGGTPGPGRTAIHDTLLELGLEPAEADAFSHAWDGALFGLASSRASDHAAIDDLPADVLTADGVPAPTESFVYFLPEATCEQVSTITLDPPPRSFRRAFAIWSAIAPSGPSH